MAFCPRPLVSDVSVCSPPQKPRTTDSKSSGKQVQPMSSLRPMSCSKSALPNGGGRPPLVKSKTTEDIAFLRCKLESQQDEIGELKDMVKSMLNSVSTSSRARTPSSADMACQTDSSCVQCGQPLDHRCSVAKSSSEEDDDNSSDEKLSNVGAQDVRSPRCEVSNSERQFVTEMIQVANKWLKNNSEMDNAESAQDEPAALVNQDCVQATRRQLAATVDHPRPFDSFVDHQPTSLSMQVNALAFRYLQQNPANPVSSGHQQQQNFTVTRRQQVLTEVSVNNFDANQQQRYARQPPVYQQQIPPAHTEARMQAPYRYQYNGAPPPACQTGRCACTAPRAYHGYN